MAASHLMRHELGGAGLPTGRLAAWEAVDLELQRRSGRCKLTALITCLLPGEASSRHGKKSCIEGTSQPRCHGRCLSLAVALCLIPHLQ